MHDHEEIHLPGYDGQPEDCQLARTATGHYLRQITITKRRQVNWAEPTHRRQTRLVPPIIFWKR